MPELKTFYQGEVIFEEGQEGDTVYIIRSGSVEISLARENKKVVLATLGDGNCFGEMASVSSTKRSATARAATYSEIYTLSASALEALLQKAHPLVQMMMKDLSKRVKTLNESAASETPAANPVLAFAQILALRAKAEEQRYVQDAHELPYDECLRILRNAVDMLAYQIQTVLQHMVGLNLISIHGSGKHMTVRLKANEIVEHAKNIVKNLGAQSTNQLQAEYELIDIDALADLMGVDQEKLYKKLSHGELPHSLFVCRKTAALALLQEHGKEFFERRKPKPIGEFTDLNDLELVDRETLQSVFGGMDAFDVARLLTTVDTSAKGLILENLSDRMRTIIESTAESIGSLDERDTMLLEQNVVEAVKNKMLQRVGG